MPDTPITASVICVTGDGPEALHGLLSRLKTQSIVQELELIIVAKPQLVAPIEALDLQDFARFQVIGHDLSSSARARAEGIRAAQGAVVIFSEDHAFPLSDRWAERLVSHHAYAAAIGPVMRNANPRTAASWASLMIEYGMWMHAPKAEFVPYIAGHNSAYDREMLLTYGDDLANMLEAEWVLQNDLRKKGYKFWIDPEIEVAHMNYSFFRASLALHFAEGRMFAASRRETWSSLHRLAFAAAAPLIFVKRLISISWTAIRGGHGRELFRCFPHLAIFLAVSAAGEGVGYALGAGDSGHLFAELEYQRWRNVYSDEAALQRAPAS
ncbi:glycosyltransferase family 2 protein [Shimia aestuarii]|uniref:glycosyltransferase family 2 protein n=1 Tax=Shimia aestuarii TaxID=254406 RepID=UPI001FB438A7|nr:hypothetical protein [Shimia aestuarii]